MWKIVFAGAALIVALALAGLAGWLFALPGRPALAEAPPLAAGEAARMVADLKPPKRSGRPLIAVIGLNDETETTDYLMPLGILRRADVADVMALATGPGPVTLYPALKVEPEATLAAFDAVHPDGADYVIVPAMSRDDDPAVMRWLRSQRSKGALIIGVCAGAKVVAAAGLLDGKRATTHWYFRSEMFGKHPSISYAADRRVVVDNGVATTTGISASIPLSLILIEAIAGRAKADEVAHDLGLATWDTRHASNAFKLTRPFALTVLGNVLSFWNRDEHGIELAPGIDEVSLALAADAWSRTYRSRSYSFARQKGPVETRSGLRIVADRTMASSSPTGLDIGGRPVEVLDRSLAAIAARYGAGTGEVVAVQLEYSRR